MITVEQIYQATHDGLDIILDIYPQAVECINKKNQHFKIRDEKTPSACLKKFNGVWKVVDFGGDGHAESPVDIYMKERGVDRFPEAILQLASMFGVSDDLKRTVNKPTFEERPALQEEKDGQRYFSFKETFDDFELKVLGPLVKQEHVDGLHWHSIKSIRYVKDRRTKIKYSNEHYPIFARECLVKEADTNSQEVKFYKIYEPLNPDKAWRFSYWPEGVKPKSYINGLSELKAAYRAYNMQKMVEFEKMNVDGKSYKEEKLPEAFICSGERDSLCVRSLGYNPLWFNSETYSLSESEYNEIMKYVEVLYNIPDIDETGVTKGTQLALKFIDIHTVWLPDWLKTYRDNRGKPRKDFRDWMELRPTKRDFKNLMNIAMPAKFWGSTLNRKSNKWDHFIDTACLYNFLSLNGFYTLHDEHSSVVRFIRIVDHVVKTVNAKDIKEFVRRWVIERAEKREILNLVLNSPRLSAAALESLQDIDLDFTDYTERTQLFFFENGTVEVTGDAINDGKKGNISMKNYVWEDNVLRHRFSKVDDMFKITSGTDIDGNQTFDIDIFNVQSNFFGYLINTSRLYWRKEMEERFQDESIEVAEEYAATNRFRIDGEGLSAKEVKEQKQNLINKIFVIGYMLHRYKSPSRAWAPLAMDNKIGDDDECNGRSGKSFFFKLLSFFLKTVKLSGRNPKLMDNPHVFDQVTRYTEMLLLDDCDRYLNTSLFYDNITSDMTVNPKNNQSFTIPFENSPKIAFTTNYVPANFDSSSEARLVYMVFSDYYHQKTQENDYLETRSIRDDFKKDLFSSGYTDEEWNNDINFLLQCCRFYLSIADKNIKIYPPMNNIINRKLKADMGANFEDWAYSYFSPESGRLDNFIVREKAYLDFKQFSGMNKITTQAMTKKLRAFAELCPYIKELNPKEFCNSKGRIIRRDKDGPDTQGPVEMIYLRSDMESLVGAHEQQDLPFT